MTTSTQRAKPKNIKPKNIAKHTTISSQKVKPSTDTIANATNTTARQWHILSQLDRKRWIGTHHIVEQLALLGFDISLRTIQRDLNALAERFPIEKNNANPQGWRWREDAPMQSLPHMNLSQAVAFSMVKDNLTQLLPPAILDELLPWFDMADQQLKTSKVAHMWLDRVRILSANQPLIAPTVDTDTKDAIYEALFQGKQLEATYRARGRTEPASYILNPIAIIQRGVVIYVLVSRNNCEPDDIRQFALHRFEVAKCLDTPANLPKNFDLDAYINAGSMGFNHPLFDSLKTTKVSNHQPPSQAIHLLFKPQAGASLLESQLSTDQQTWEDDDGLHVTATVNLTSQLVWWLRGFGKGLLNIEPEILSLAVLEN